MLESVSLLNYHFDCLSREERLVVTLTDSAFDSLIAYGKRGASARDWMNIIGLKEMSPQHAKVTNAATFLPADMVRTLERTKMSW